MYKTKEVILFSVVAILLISVRPTLSQCTAIVLSSIDSSDYISTPNYPANYPGNQYICWYVTADGLSSQLGSSSSSIRVALEVIDSQLETNVYCSYDYASVREGTSSSVVVKEWCGDTNPGVIISSGSSMYVQFRSDNSFAFRGFRARYLVVQTPELAVNFLSDSPCALYEVTSPNITYVMSTPNYPSNYGQSTNMCWIITISSKIENYQHYRIQFSVGNSDLEVSSTCLYDHAAAYDGTTSSSPLIKKWCGKTLPPRLTSCESSMYIAFYSDDSVSHKGFQATYKIALNSTTLKCGAEVEPSQPSSTAAYLVGIAISLSVIIISATCVAYMLYKQNHKPTRRVHPPRDQGNSSRRRRAGSAWEGNFDRGISPPPPYPGTPTPGSRPTPRVFFTTGSGTADSQGRVDYPNYAPPSYDESIAQFGPPPASMFSDQQLTNNTPNRQEEPSTRDRGACYITHSRGVSGRSAASRASPRFTIDVSREPVQSPPGTVVINSPRTDAANQLAVEQSLQLPAGEDVTSAPPSPALYRSPTPGGNQVVSLRRDHSQMSESRA